MDVAEQPAVSRPTLVRARGLDASWRVLPVLVLCVLAALVIDRPGYSPDEEITAVAATAIGSAGVPLLPSGILYNRGLPYLYVAWLSGALFGPSMIAWRFASLLCAAAGLVAAFRIGATSESRASGVLLALLLASFPPYVSASVFARPYSAVVASALFFIWLFSRWVDDRRRSWLALLSLACATLLHPIGATLAGLPMVFVALDERQRRASTLRFALACCGVVAFTACLSYGAHFASLRIAGLTASASTAIYAIPSPSFPAAYVFAFASYRSWIAALLLFALLGYVVDRSNPGARPLTAVCVVCGLGFQLGAMLLAGAIAIIVRPSNARRSVLCVVCIAAVSIAWWSIHTAAATDARLSLPFALGLVGAAALYPLNGVRFTVDAFPAIATLAVLGCAGAMFRPDNDRSRLTRGVAVLAIALLGVFGAASVPMSERYLLVPWTLLAIVAIGGVTAILELASRRVTRFPAARVMVSAILAGASAWLLVGNYRYGRDRETLVPVSIAQHLFAPVTVPSWTPERLHALVASGDEVVCTEELACQYLIGRLNYLFALPPRDVAHYVVSRAGASVGFYAGAPVISSGAQLEGVVREREPRGCVVVVTLRTGKVGFDEYNTLVADAAARFDSDVLFSSDEMHVSRMCGSGH